jgi:hypothetical protein
VGGAAVKAAMAKVIPFHLEGMKAGGEVVVDGPESVVEWVQV